MRAERIQRRRNYIPAYPHCLHNEKRKYAEISTFFYIFFYSFCHYMYICVGKCPYFPHLGCICFLFIFFFYSWYITQNIHNRRNATNEDFVPDGIATINSYNILFPEHLVEIYIHPIYIYICSANSFLYLFYYLSCCTRTHIKTN